MRLPNFDLDALRSLAAGVDLGSFAKAADQLGRSTSAVSAQLKKLEDQAGTPLFRRAGRGLELTDAGQTLLGYARRLLELNDEAAAAVRGAELTGEVRLGLQEDFGEILLAEVLGRFVRAHPRLKVDVCVARSAELSARIAQGRLDLALAWDATGGTMPGRHLMALPLCWIGPTDTRVDAKLDPGEPVPLVLLDAPCPLREIAAAHLEQAGLRWRHAFTSASLTALWAASAAGLGLTMRTRVGLPPNLVVFEAGERGLPPLPVMDLVLVRAPTAQPGANRLVDELEALLLQAIDTAVAHCPHQPLPAWRQGNEAHEAHEANALDPAHLPPGRHPGPYAEGARATARINAAG